MILIRIRNTAYSFCVVRRKGINTGSCFSLLWVGPPCSTWSTPLRSPTTRPRSTTGNTWPAAASTLKERLQILSAQYHLVGYYWWQNRWFSIIEKAGYFRCRTTNRFKSWQSVHYLKSATFSNSSNFYTLVLLLLIVVLVLILVVLLLVLVLLFLLILLVLLLLLVLFALLLVLVLLIFVLVVLVLLLLLILVVLLLLVLVLVLLLKKIRKQSKLR